MVRDADKTKAQLINELIEVRLLIAEIAHEINNPLAGIKNSFRLIKDAIPEDHPYYEYAGRIEREIDRMARIVHQMFDLYQTEQASAGEFIVNEAIRDVVSLLEADGRVRGVNITIEMPEAPIVVTKQEGHLVQVLFNVIQNAIEASRQGGQVKVVMAAVKDALTIMVSDQGGGIPAEIHAQIFEPFFTTRDSKATGGLGLGLSVSKSMVEAMGGTIDFESKIGQGTVFRIILP